MKDGTLTTKDIKNRSLLARDFKRNQLPAGPAGPKGDPGPKGDTGTVDTSRFYDKEASDARFLGKAEKASDAEKFDGIDSSLSGEASYLFS